MVGSGMFLGRTTRLRSRSGVLVGVLAVVTSMGLVALAPTSALVRALVAMGWLPAAEGLVGLGRLPPLLLGDGLVAGARAAADGWGSGVGDFAGVLAPPALAIGAGFAPAGCGRAGGLVGLIG